MHSVRSVRAQFQDRRDDVSEPRKADRSQRLGIAFRKQGRLIEVIADDRTSADDRGRTEVHAERSLHRDENGLPPYENSTKAVFQVGYPIRGRLFYLREVRTHGAVRRQPPDGVGGAGEVSAKKGSHPFVETRSNGVYGRL